MKPIRNSNIEVLRFFLISSICIWHLFIWGCGMRYIGSQVYIYEESLWLHLLICSLCCPGVYCFMFISGFYGIKASLKKLFVLVFTGGCCFVVGTIINYYIWGDIDLGYVLRHILTISSNQWWFLTSYVWVFLMSPFINKGMDIMSKKELKHALLMLSIMQLGTFVGVPDCIGGSSFLGLSYMYLLGG